MLRAPRKVSRLTKLTASALKARPAESRAADQQVSEAARETAAETAREAARETAREARKFIGPMPRIVTFPETAAVTAAALPAANDAGMPSLPAQMSAAHLTARPATTMDETRDGVASGLGYLLGAVSHRASYRATGKRAFDLLAVLAAAPFWVPLIAICALIVARDGHKPFYMQDRVGRGGRIFRMIKLRSMVPDAHVRLEAHLAANPEARAEWDATQKLKNDPRITGIGRIIRKMSIDELPQVLNVLRGDMSLVGPRPFMTNQTDLYKGEGYYRLRPGLTGFWQVTERNESDFVARVDFDDAYERTVSFVTDLSVLRQTVAVVLRGTGY